MNKTVDYGFPSPLGTFSTIFGNANPKRVAAFRLPANHRMPSHSIYIFLLFVSCIRQINWRVTCLQHFAIIYKWLFCTRTQRIVTTAKTKIEWRKSVSNKTFNVCRMSFYRSQSNASACQNDPGVNGTTRRWDKKNCRAKLENYTPKKKTRKIVPSSHIYTVLVSFDRSTISILIERAMNPIARPYA